MQHIILIFLLLASFLFVQESNGENAEETVYFSQPFQSSSGALYEAIIDATQVITNSADTLPQMKITSNTYLDNDTNSSNTTPTTVTTSATTAPTTTKTITTMPTKTTPRPNINANTDNSYNELTKQLTTYKIILIIMSIFLVIVILLFIFFVMAKKKRSLDIEHPRYISQTCDDKASSKEMRQTTVRLSSFLPHVENTDGGSDPGTNENSISSFQTRKKSNPNASL